MLTFAYMADGSLWQDAYVIKKSLKNVFSDFFYYYYLHHEAALTSESIKVSCSHGISILSP